MLGLRRCAKHTHESPVRARERIVLSPTPDSDPSGRARKPARHVPGEGFSLGGRFDDV